MKRTFLLTTALLAGSTALHASQEAAIAFQKLHFEARLPDDGLVVIEATQDTQGMQRFVVQAFGRSHQLTTAQLHDLDGRYNSIQVSGEEGYPELGGRTLYIKLSMSFTSSTPRRIKYVVINQAGTVAVKDRP